MPSTPWPKEPLHVNLIATSAGHALTCWAAEAWTREVGPAPPRRNAGSRAQLRAQPR